LFRRLFERHQRERTVAGLYGRIVTQARHEGFYTDAGVPDTLEGRFELIALHAWLVMRRLREGGEAALEFNQLLFDFMFADMDSCLRELGVGDLKVGERIKDMARHFYGRVAAYESGLAPDAAADALAGALDRNLYGSTLPDREHLDAMAGYIRREAARLSDVDVERIMAGEIGFGPPPMSGTPQEGRTET